MVNYNNYILWAQSDTYETEDIIIVDGKTPKDALRKEFFSYIFPGFSPVKWKLVNFNPAPSEVNGVTPSLKVYVHNDEKLIMSNYLSKDNKGRRIAFIFCAKSEIERLCSDLKSASSNLNFNYNNADLDFLLKYKKKILYKEKGYLKTIFYILTILLIITCICLINNCQN